MSKCYRNGTLYKRHQYKTKYGETKCAACGKEKSTSEQINEVEQELVECTVKAVVDSWKEIDSDYQPAAQNSIDNPEEKK